MTRATTILPVITLLLAAAACDHTAPFAAGAGAEGLDTTFGSGSPRQLTFNLGTDLTPAWTSDGGSILYAAERPTGDRDRCLVRLPGTGGTIQSTLCGNQLGGLDSTDVWAWPAVAGDGRLLYTRVWSGIGSINPAGGALELASVDRPDAASILRTFPYSAAGGQVHQGISNVGWLDANTAVYIGERIDYPRDCSSCPPDTLATGLSLVQVDLASTPAQFSLVPGTGGISSAAPFGSSAVLATTEGSAVVNQLDLGTGAAIPIHDFAAEGIARDVQTAGGRMVVVVGGKVSYTVDSALGPLQRDEGGLLHVVNLATGEDQSYIVESIDSATGQRTGLLFRHPALRPDGHAVVVEGYPFLRNVIRDANGNVIAVDTVVTHTSDLWLFDLP